MHAAGVGDSAGVLLSLLGLAIINGLSMVSLKLIMLMRVTMITNSTSTYSLMQIAIKTKVKLFKKSS